LTKPSKNGLIISLLSPYFELKYGIDTLIKYMEYPDSKLTHWMRLTFLITYIIIFLVLCPILILYASGFRYDWKQGFPRRTGAISINVEPVDVQVYANKVLVPRDLDVQSLSYKDEVRLTSAPPGKYVIKITKPGYYDWIKDVEIKEMQTVYIKEAILMKKNEAQKLDDGQINTLALSPDNNYLAYTKTTAQNTEIWLRDLTVQNNKQLLTFENTAVALEWNSKSEWLVVSNATPPFNSVVIIPLANPDKKFDLVKLLKYPVDKYQWKDSIDPELFFSTKLKLSSIFPVTKKILSLSKNTFLDWKMEDGQLWTLDSDTSTAKIFINKDTLGFKKEFNTLDSSTLGNEWNKTKILAVARDSILLQDRAKMETVLINKTGRFNLGSNQALISEYGNWWLMWSPWELWSAVEGEEPVLINRSGEQLREVLPMDKFNALALVWANNVTILYPYYLVTHTFIDTPVLDATVNTKDRIFYFSSNSSLWSLEY